MRAVKVTDMDVIKIVLACFIGWLLITQVKSSLPDPAAPIPVGAEYTGSAAPTAAQRPPLFQFELRGTINPFAVKAKVQ